MRNLVHSLWFAGGLPLAAACGGGGSGTTTPPPPPPAVALAKADPSGDNQTAQAGNALSQPLRVRATRAGAPAAGETVAWSSGSGLVAGHGATDANGIATATWTLGNLAGVVTASASVGSAMVQFTATATAPPAPPIVIVFASPSGDAQAAQRGTLLPDALRVLVTQGGVPLAGRQVAWVTSATNGFLDAPTTTTSAAGIATNRWTLGTPLGAQGASAAVAGGGPELAFTATATAGPVTNPVEIHATVADGGRFRPAGMVIAAGTTVRWIWDDGPHTVTSTGAPAFAGNPTAAEPPTIYEFTFTLPGTYRYYCTVHGNPSAGMHGTIVVE